MSHTTNMPQAREFMNRKVQSVTPDVTLAEVIAKLREQDVSNLPVVEETVNGPLLVGFISEGDCLEYVSNELFYGNPSPPQTARTIMKRHPVCVQPGTNLFTLASILVNHKLRHLPVVENDILVGIVSRRDVLQAMEKVYREALNQKEHERFRPDLHEIMNHRFIVSN